MLFRSTIFTEVPMTFSISDLEIIEPDYDFAVQTLKSYELNTIIGKLKKGEEVKADDQVYELVDVKALIKILGDSESFGFKLFYDQVGIVEKKLVGAVFQHDASIYVLKAPQDLVQLKDIFENQNIRKFGFDVKHEYLYLMDQGVDLCGVDFDGFIAAYLIEPASRNYNLSEEIGRAHV